MPYANVSDVCVCCVCGHTYIYIYMYVCVCVFTCIYIHVYMYIYDIYVYTYMFMYIYIHIYIIRANAHPDPLTRHQKSSHISLAKLCPLSASRLLCARRSSLNASSASRRNPIYILCMYVYICIYMCV